MVSKLKSQQREIIDKRQETDTTQQKTTSTQQPAASSQQPALSSKQTADSRQKVRTNVRHGIDLGPHHAIRIRAWEETGCHRVLALVLLGSGAGVTG
jgi:hypothetical protein